MTGRCDRDHRRAAARLPAALAAALPTAPLIVCRAGRLRARRAGRGPGASGSNGWCRSCDHLRRSRASSRVVFAGAVRRPRLDPALFDPAHRAAGAAASGRDAGGRRCHAARGDRDFRGGGFRGRRRRRDGARIWCRGRGCWPDGRPSADEARCRPRRGDRRGAWRGRCRAGRGRGAGPVPGGRGAARHRCDAGLRGRDRAAPAPRSRRRARACSTRRRSPGRTAASTCPTLGPDDPARAPPRPGLRGIAWQAGGVICLDRAAMRGRGRRRAGLFLWSRRAMKLFLIAGEPRAIGWARR